MVNHQSKNRLQLVYPKVKFWAHFFLIYINDLRLGLTTNVKLFADDTSLFSNVNNVSVSASRLNNDLVKIQDGLSIGKFPLNQILLSKRKRLFFQKK